MSRPPGRLALAVILALAVAAEGQAQPAAKVPRIGVLVTGSLDSAEARATLDVFREGLRERGYVEGQTIIFEYRAAHGQIERFPDLAAELARLPVDLILAPNTPAARAAGRATTTIPIVVTAMGDPVGDGLVRSLARPGGNITGLTFLGPELVPKRLELLKQALPRVSRVAVLWQPGAFSEGTTHGMLRGIEAAGRNLGVQLQLVAVRDPAEVDRALAAIVRERAEAIVVSASTMLFSERRRIADLAAKHRRPLVGNAREFVEVGALMAYGASLTDLMRRGAVYADRILKGGSPAELPVEQPSKFELVINLRTAKALGLTIPPPLLQRADHVIE